MVQLLKANSMNTIKLLFFFYIVMYVRDGLAECEMPVSQRAADLQ